MAFDDSNDRVVLFGGSGLGGTLGDTWLWDGASWQPQFVAAPSPRYEHAMVYDSGRAGFSMVSMKAVAVIGPTPFTANSPHITFCR